MMGSVRTYGLSFLWFLGTKSDSLCLVFSISAIRLVQKFARRYLYLCCGEVSLSFSCILPICQWNSPLAIAWCWAENKEGLPVRGFRWCGEVYQLCALDKYTEVHFPTKAPNRRYKERFAWHIEAWTLLTYEQIKHPEDVQASSLNLTRTENIAPLYANVLTAWLTVHPKARTDVWIVGRMDMSREGGFQG
jgi:hypothetical protein